MRARSKGVMPRKAASEDRQPVWSPAQLQQKVREAQDAVWSQTASPTEANQLLLQLQAAAKTDCGGIFKAACSAPGPETTERAVAMCRAFIARDPGDAHSFLQLAMVRRQAGSHDLAAIETLEAVRLSKEGTSDWARVVGLAHDVLIANPLTAEMCSGRVERPEWMRGKALGRVSQAAFDVAPDDFYVCQMQAFACSHLASRRLDAVALFRKAAGLSALETNKMRCAELADACLEAHKTTIGKGIRYRLTGLQARPELNATPCTALRPCEGPEGRWEVLLESGDTIRVLPEKLEHVVECNQRFPDIVKQYTGCKDRSAADAICGQDEPGALQGVAQAQALRRCCSRVCARVARFCFSKKKGDIYVNVC